MPGKNIVGGVISITIDGVKIRCKSGAEYELGVPELTPVVGADEMHGSKETPKPASLKVTTTHVAGLDVKALLTKRDATVFMELPNGEGVVFSESTVGPAGPLTTDEGEIPLMIYAKRAEPV